MIDLNGEFIIEAEYDEILKEKGYYLLRKASKWGVTNDQGRVISYPTFDKITVGNSFLKVEKYKTVRILSEKGTNLIDNQFDEIYFDEKLNVFLAKKNIKKGTSFSLLIF